MAGRKSDFTLPTLDDLFSTQEMRDDAKLAKIRDKAQKKAKGCDCFVICPPYRHSYCCADL